MPDTRIVPMAPPSGAGCVECLASDGWWLHLRRCATCGHIGCCDTSPNQHATAHFLETGHYIITVMRSDRAKYAANDRTQGTADEYKATAQGTFTYFGTYTVSEPDRTLDIHVVGSSFPNWNGTDQKRRFAVSADELKLTNPVASTGGTTEVVWKRAR